MATLPVGDLVTREVVVVEESRSVYDAIGIMRRHGIRRLPVIDERACLVGLVAFDDLLELLADQIGGLVSLLIREQHNESIARRSGET